MITNELSNEIVFMRNILKSIFSEQFLKVTNKDIKRALACAENLVNILEHEEDDKKIKSDQTESLDEIVKRLSSQNEALQEDATYARDECYRLSRNVIRLENEASQLQFRL